MKIKNLSAVFTGSGFLPKRGRFISFEDCGFQKGPIDISIDPKSKSIQKVATSDNESSHEEFDGHGLVATAAFVDSHTHTFFAGERSREYFLRWSGAQYAEIAKQGGGIHNTNRDTAEMALQNLEDLFVERLQSMLSSGSTTIEVKSGYAADAAGELRILRSLKKILNSSARPGLPTVKTTFLGLHALPKGLDEKTYVDSMKAILPTIQSESLADYIDAFPEEGFFSLEAAKDFVQAGLEHGLKAKVHADEITDMKAAKNFSEMQALSVDHLQQVQEDGLKALANSSTVATLLPATSFFLGLPYANARKFLDSGVQVALATDFNPGTAPKKDMPFTQLLAASHMKMSPAEILCASTWNGAAAMGLSDRGLLTQGQRADLLLWKTPPAHNKQELLEHIFLGVARLEKVFLGGYPLSC